MQYEVRCECGKSLAVSAADAGSSLRCACGKPVDVPPLHQLRTSGGDTAVPMISQVRAALRNGLLPGTRACGVCATETNHQCRVKVMCERVQVRERPSQAEVAGCLLAPWVGLWMFLFGWWSRKRRASVGDEEAVIVPLPVCDACRPKLNDANALVPALRKIPDYAALLDRYPKAEVTPVL